MPFQFGSSSIDVTKVYSLQDRLRNLIAEIKEDEKGITDPSAREALETTRGLIEGLVNNVEDALKKEKALK